MPSMSQKRSRTDGHLSKEQYNEGGGGASSSTQVTVQPSRTHSSTKGAGWLRTNGSAAGTAAAAASALFGLPCVHVNAYSDSLQ